MNMRRTMTMALLALVVTVLWGIGPPQAQAIDESKVPHYFGPYPNWALSPLPVKNPDGTVSGGIRKFVDTLPGLTKAGANNLGNYLPVAVADQAKYANKPGTPDADYYEIGLVQYRQQMHSDLPPSLLRGYVQLSTTAVPGEMFPLTNELMDGTKVAVRDAAGNQLYGVTKPSYLGPVIVATKDKPVRILFRNLLPSGAGGDLFLPVDQSLMGAGPGMMDEPYSITPTVGGDVTDAVRNPMCSGSPKDTDKCFADNRATLHLHGGITPWISDGTPHQWITPADQVTPWPKGVSVVNVPDMPDPGPGAMTFFYTNQQSARLMFYHDHSWGITRLNVYAGEAAGYLITDDAEKALVNAGIIPGADRTIPLIIQDRTFVPKDEQLYTQKDAQGNVTSYGQDPTWDKSRWGGFGNFWYHHVYMPAQNPGDAGGMSAYGRWMYGPWFWPPALDTKYGPIDNPYYNPACNIDDPSTWQYQVDPFCEPELIPGTPNVSAGMEQFNDTPMVNGTVYPTTTVEPKPYRLRVLNAANDRFFNLQLYVADDRTASTALNAVGEVIGGTEVALKQAELDAAQDDPNVFPTPDTALSAKGPNWVMIGTEGGFLPAPVEIPPQPTTWVTDPTRFDVGNVKDHSLLVAPAERADVIVDFSQYAGKTLILYNDAPAAFPARVPSYDYYTGAPDQSPNGAPYVLPGYGPNTRTVMQIKVKDVAGTPYNLQALKDAFAHGPDKPGIFEVSQHPIIIGQAAYNSAYGTSFASNSWCNRAGSTLQRCDGFARITDQGGDLFGFNTLFNPAAKTKVPIEPKAIHDEMNSSTFDEFGRMQANLGIEAVPATPGLTNVNLMPYTFPPTEIIDASKLPSSISVTPIEVGTDGTQIWKITHNGVDTHPIHFHLYDVQVVNRVTWDNIVMPPHPSELGWKDTVRVSPLQDTIVALRPIIPVLPFDLPNSIRLLSPMLPEGAPIALASAADAAGVGIPPSNGAGEPVDIYNHKVNFGAEYVWHCHILSHEEMDMMRPQAVAIPPVAPANLAVLLAGTGADRKANLTWADKSLSETGWEIERAASASGPWTVLASFDSSTGPQNTGTINYTDAIGADNYFYRVRAINVVGDTYDYANPNINEIISGGFPNVKVRSAYSNTAAPQLPVAGRPAWIWVPSTTTTLTNTIGWGASATAGVTYEVVEAQDAAFTTGVRTVYTGTALTAAVTVAAPGTYYYRVRATEAGYLPSQWATSGPMTVATQKPAWLWVPATTTTETFNAGWGQSPSAGAAYELQEAQNAAFTQGLRTVYTGQALTAPVTISASGTYYYRIRATSAGATPSAWVTAGPTTASLTAQKPGWIWAPATTTTDTNTIGWGASTTAAVSYELQEAQNAAFTTGLRTVYTGTATSAGVAINSSGQYYYRVRAVKAGYASSQWVVTGPMNATLTALAPTWAWAPSQSNSATFAVGWGASATAGTSYELQQAQNASFTTGLTTVYSGSALTASVTVPAPGTYYFRVRAVKTGYQPSAWKATAGTTVN